MKRKLAGAVILSFLPCPLSISVGKPLMSQRRKQQRNRKCLLQGGFTPHPAVPPRTHTKLLRHVLHKVYQKACLLPAWKPTGLHPSAIWNLILYLVSSQRAGKVQGALTNFSGRRSSIHGAVSARQCSQNPPPNLQLHKLLKGAVLECAAYPASEQRAVLCPAWMRNVSAKPWESNVQ